MNDMRLFASHLLIIGSSRANLAHCRCPEHSYLSVGGVAGSSGTEVFSEKR